MSSSMQVKYAIEKYVQGYSSNNYVIIHVNYNPLQYNIVFIILQYTTI